MNLIFLDFETFYDSIQGYDLKNLSIVEYVRDPRFKIFGCGFITADVPYWLKTLHNKDHEWNNSVVVSHNVKFDGFILKQHYGIQPKRWICTKAMAKAVLGKRVKNYSLKTLAEYFGLFPKGQLKTDGLTGLTQTQEDELAEYCLHDVELCKQIYEKLAPGFPNNQYEIMNWTIQSFVNPKLELNTALLAKAAEDENKRRTNIFKEIGIDKKEFASNVKFPQLLHFHGYEVPYKLSPRTKKTIPAIALGDPEFLELLESPDEELKKLCEARVAAKSTLLETRSEKLAKIGKTGSWPFDVEFSGATQTHRFSGGSGAGGNPQNFTRNSALREAVTAPKGYKLVVGDFSNIEMRLVAYLSRDPGLIEAIENERDIYCDFATLFYGRIITKEDVNERRFGKTAILGLGYGMGPKKFQKTVRLQTGQVITDEDAKRAVNLYRAKYSKVPALWQKYERMIVDINTWNSYTLPSGLKLQYPKLRRVNDEWIYDVYDKGQLKQTKLYGGKLLENICQALAGELCKDVIRQFHEDIVGQVHDEVLMLVPEEAEDEAKYRLKAVMETPPSWLPDIKLQATVGSGNNWKEAK